MAYVVVRRQAAPEAGAAVLLDVSSSMNTVDNPRSGSRRIDQLADVLEQVLNRAKAARLFAFNWVVHEIEAGEQVALPEPDGGTDLAGALEYLAGLQAPHPDQLIIITDGEPNDADAALAAMAAMQRVRPVRVHCRYCGPDDRDALAFLDKLAFLGKPGSTSGKANLAMPGLVADDIVGLIGHAKG